MIERFYADSINNDNLVDLIVVDTKNKRYALYLNQIYFSYVIPKKGRG